MGAVVKCGSNYYFLLIGLNMKLKILICTVAVVTVFQFSFANQDDTTHKYTPESESYRFEEFGKPENHSLKKAVEDFLSKSEEKQYNSNNPSEWAQEGNKSNYSIMTRNINKKPNVVPRDAPSPSFQVPTWSSSSS